jgi:hypothetical protein
LNLFGVVRLAVEFPATGRIIAYVGNVETVKAFK